MLVVDLHCANGHAFEGWFASADDLSSQQARGLVSCPVCGDHEVVRRPSAPRLNVSHLRSDTSTSRVETATPTTPGPSAPVSDAVLDALQAAYLQVVRHVVDHAENVGERFADEARDIHRGDAPARLIRGQTSIEEREALRDEGIEVLSLPIPEGLEGPVQ